MINETKNYILANEFTVKEESVSAAIHSWKKLYEGLTDRVLYKHSEKNSLLELTLLDKPSSIETELSSPLRLSYQDLVKPTLLTDWRMQLLGLKNKVITGKSMLPDTKYLQWRYIEVPLSVYDDYFQWRRANIFKYVERFPEINYFMAYHSTLSTKPGVVFLSGFSGDVDKYMDVFNADEFQKVSTEAKQKYILGGDQGLALTLYSQV